MGSLDVNFIERVSKVLDPGCFCVIDPNTIEEPRGIYNNQSKYIAKPKNTNQVSKIIELANEFSVGVVPYGGSTGLVGGQIGPNESYLLLSLENMTSVREISHTDYIYTVEAGMLLSDFKLLVKQQDRLFPLSLSSEGSCQIGGNLATNAGGVNVLRYGNMRDLCLGIEAVMANGKVINDLKGLKKDNMGIDIRNLLIGSEGSLGIITAATLKTFPEVVQNTVAIISISSPKMALRIFSELQKHFENQIQAFELIKSTGLSFLNRAGINFVEPFLERPDWLILLDISTVVGYYNIEGDVEIFLMKCIKMGLCDDVLIAQNEKQKYDFWQIRHKIPEANRKVGPICSNDISIPISRIPEFISKTDESIKKISTNIIINCFGHLGDGNLHYNIFPGEEANKPSLLLLKSEIILTINEFVADFGGSCSAEHGVGRLRVLDMNKYCDTGKLAAMARIKIAMDPNGILNPGVIFQNTSKKKVSLIKDS